MNKEALKQILDAMKLHTAETHPIVETERAMEMIEAELAQKPVRREQRLFMEEQEFYESPTRRMCPNTYYECSRECGDEPCKDFYDAHDTKEQP